MSCLVNSGDPLVEPPILIFYLADPLSTRQYAHTSRAQYYNKFPLLPRMAKILKKQSHDSSSSACLAICKSRAAVDFLESDQKKNSP